MAWITLPFPAFHLESGRQPAQQLDDDFAAIVNALNAFNPSGGAAGPGASYQIRNLQGFNNSGTPTTKYDISFGQAVLISPVNGSAMVLDTTGAITNDIGVSGPIVNGRDSVAAFSASSWIHLYLIGNPSGPFGTISSATAPTIPGGPALPSGYTHWAYACALRLDAGVTIIPTYSRGAQMMYRNTQQVVSTNATVINTETTVSVASQVPPNALTFELMASMTTMNAVGGGMLLDIRVVTGQNFSVLRGTMPSTFSGAVCAQITVPNVGQQYFYLWNVDTPSTPALDETQQWVSGYRVANGGE